MTAIREAGRALAQDLGQMRVIVPGRSWGVQAVTDREETEHRVDLLAGDLYCTCRGFIKWRHCKHAELIGKMENMEANKSLVLADTPGQLPTIHRSPQALASRLAEMVQERGIVAAFFKDVMEVGHDYGIIPGTDKPTLFKPGAEKLAELYGYAPVVRDRQGEPDPVSGFYRVVITMGLINKDTGTLVAEGVGECNTREARYFYRWVGENRIPAGVDKASLKSEERQFRDKRTGQMRKWIAYRLENDDLFTLWNTVLKMAKKRALVDAVLSSTRSSGIFGRSAQEVQEWIDAEYTDLTESPDDDDEDEIVPPKQARAQARTPRASANGSKTAPASPGTQPSPEAARQPSAPAGATDGATQQEPIGAGGSPAAPPPYDREGETRGLYAVLKELHESWSAKDYAAVYGELTATYPALMDAKGEVSKTAPDEDVAAGLSLVKARRGDPD